MHFAPQGASGPTLFPYTTLFRSEARRHQSLKRGGDMRAQELSDQHAIANSEDLDELLDLDAALTKLASDEPALAKLVELRRSEEHTSELQSQFQLVCRLPLEKKKASVTRMCSSALLLCPPHVSTLVLPPASLIAAPPSARSPGVFSMSLTRSAAPSERRADRR